MHGKNYGVSSLKHLQGKPLVEVVAALSGILSEYPEATLEFSNNADICALYLCDETAQELTRKLALARLQAVQELHRAKKAVKILEDANRKVGEALLKEFTNVASDHK